jgi:rubrerythrin
MPTPEKSAPKDDGAANALTRALRFEKTGMQYYELAASKAGSPFTKRTFTLLADMERKHMKAIMEISQRLEEKGKFPPVSTTDSEGRMRMFEAEAERIRKEDMITGDAAAAMRKALGLEAEGREMYLRMSQAATNPQEKKFFRMLWREEEAHFEIIYEYLDYLEERGLRMRGDG